MAAIFLRLPVAEGLPSPTSHPDAVSHKAHSACALTWPRSASPMTIPAWSNSRPVARSSSMRDFSYAAIAETRLDSLVAKTDWFCKTSVLVEAPRFNFFCSASSDLMTQFYRGLRRYDSGPVLHHLELGVAHLDANLVFDLLLDASAPDGIPVPRALAERRRCGYESECSGQADALVRRARVDQLIQCSGVTNRSRQLGSRSCRRGRDRTRAETQLTDVRGG